MPAYNPPQQVLFSPVSNYYQGKAIRTQQKANEQAIEFNELKMDVMKDELENAPSKREQAKKLAELQIENLQSQVDERYAKGERDKLKYADEIMKPLYQAYSAEEDEDKALEIFNSSLPEAISRLPEDEQAKFIEAAGPDRVFDHNEIVMSGLYRRLVEEKEKTAQNFADADGNLTGSYVEGTPEYAAAIADPNQFLAGDVSQTQKTRDLSAEEAAVNAREKDAVAMDMRATLRGYTETPGAGGIGGWITDKVGGLAGALPGQIGVKLEQGISQMFSDTSPEEVASLRAAAETDLPLFLRMITGDTSRYSDRDVALAKAAQKATDPTASPSQIQGAYSNMVRVSYRQSFRSMKLAQQELPFKFNSSPEDDAAIKSFISGLREDGVSEPVIRELIIDIESLTTNAWKDRIGLPVDLQ